MVPVYWPPWISWLLLFAVLITLFLVWMMARTMGAMRHSMATAGIGRTAPARNRSELEEMYRRGSIDRERYDYWKERIRT